MNLNVYQFMFELFFTFFSIKTYRFHPFTFSSIRCLAFSCILSCCLQLLSLSLFVLSHSPSLLNITIYIATISVLSLSTSPSSTGVEMYYFFSKIVHKIPLTLILSYVTLLSLYIIQNHHRFMANEIKT